MVLTNNIIRDFLAERGAKIYIDLLHQACNPAIYEIVSRLFLLYTVVYIYIQIQILLLNRTPPPPPHTRICNLPVLRGKIKINNVKKFLKNERLIGY